MYVYDYNHYDDCVYVNPKYFVIKKQQQAASIYNSLIESGSQGQGQGHIDDRKTIVASFLEANIYSMQFNI